MGNDLIRRCCACKSIEIDGVLYAKGEYPVADLNEKEFTDGFLSYMCVENLYGKEMADKMRVRRTEGTYDECPKSLEKD